MQFPSQDALILDTQGWAPGEEVLDLDGYGVPALFRAIEGSWQGIYYKLNPEASRLRDFEGVFTISITGNCYRQTNRYRFDDGSSMELAFSGLFENGILTMVSESRQGFRGLAWQAGPNLILFESLKQEDGVRIRYLEMILFDSPTTRARTTLEYRDGAFTGVNFIREVKLDAPQAVAA
jgi:hypothetical protein